MKSVGLKKHPKKNLCISVKSVGQNFHRISRIFGRLANGSRQICAAIVFGHADFADGADFSSWDYFLSHRFHRFTQIFLRGIILSHRFHRFTQIFYGISGESLCPISGGICNDRTGRLCEIPCHPMMKKICVICEICVTKKTSQEKSVYICEICGTFYTLRGYLFFVGLFFSHRFHRYTQIFYGISGESLCPISGGICNARTGRICEIPCHPMTKKICVICEICVTKKNVPR